MTSGVALHKPRNHLRPAIISFAAQPSLSQVSQSLVSCDTHNHIVIYVCTLIGTYTRLPSSITSHSD